MMTNTREPPMSDEGKNIIKRKEKKNENLDIKRREKIVQLENTQH
jgi:hypothetical protein